MGLRCLLLDHEWVHDWEGWTEPAYGVVEVEYKECVHCGKRVPTGRDRHVPKDL